MPPSVILVESAYLAKALQSIIKGSGDLDGFRCLATFGRLKDVVAEKEIDPRNIHSERDFLHESVVRALSAIRDSNVYIATDNDIEGELIASDLVSLLIKNKNNNIMRININEITLPGVVESINRPVDISGSMVEACLARRGVDIAIKQQNAGVGRVLSRALSGIQELNSHYEKEAMIVELNLSGKNTLTVMVEMALQDIKPKEVDFSLQKLYAQGRISYPRTLAGISPSRNLLCDVETHDEIALTSSSSKKSHHYDTLVDGKIFSFLESSPTSTCMNRYPAKPNDERDLKALLQLYRMPFTRASTLGHHAHRIASLMSASSEGLSCRGWELYHHAQTSLPSLCTQNGSKVFNSILHLGVKNHRDRIQDALEKLSYQDVVGGGQKSNFHYPDKDSQAPSPSPSD